VRRAPWIFLTSLDQVKTARGAVKGFALSAESSVFCMQDVSPQ
jgi:hypothetical protein